MPKPAVTRINGAFAVQANTLPNNGLYAPRLTTTQRDVIPASVLANGAIIYNTTTNQFELYKNGAWVVAYDTADSTGVLIVSAVANAAALPATPVNGMVVYQTDTNLFKVRQEGEWCVMYNTNSTATGDGLNTGDSPFTLGQGASAGVEIAANEANGFMYYNTTANNIRARVNGQWGTIAAGISTGAAPTVGFATLVGGSVTVNTTAVAASSNIFLQTQGIIGTANSGNVRVSAIIANTSFTITSSEVADTSIVRWFIVNA
jgi:hypothetical protein